MELSKKIKTALDETRMLILGAQILLGFELRGVFAEAFEQLPEYVRHLDAVGLGLTVVAVGLLIAPEPYHRIVEDGSDSGAFHDYVTDIADLALLPFALALGIDVFVATVRVFAGGWAAAAGGAAAVLALVMWYGGPRACRATTGEHERAMTKRQRNERPQTPLHMKIEQLLTEARVILPGAQAVFGFQLLIVLTSAFDHLPDTSRWAHAASLGLVALAVVLLMAPAAYHRIVYGGEENEDMYRTASNLVTVATVPLALGLSVDLYVVVAKIAGTSAGIGSAAAALVLLFVLWYAYPAVAALRQLSRSRRQSG